MEPKSKPKPKPKSKPKPKPKPKKQKNTSGIIIENEQTNGGSTQSLDVKYSEKVNLLVTKIKNQNESKPDVKIRFGWKY